MNKICSNCGNKVNTDDNFCTNCGKKLEQTGLICSKCGCSTKIDDIFCVNCGVKINNDNNNNNNKTLFLVINILRYIISIILIIHIVYSLSVNSYNYTIIFEFLLSLSVLPFIYDYFLYDKINREYYIIIQVLVPIIVIVLLGVSLFMYDKYIDNNDNNKSFENRERITQNQMCAYAICSECDSKTKQCKCSYLDENGIKNDVICSIDN